MLEWYFAMGFDVNILFPQGDDGLYKLPTSFMLLKPSWFYTVSL